MTGSVGFSLQVAAWCQLHRCEPGQSGAQLCALSWECQRRFWQCVCRPDVEKNGRLDNLHHHWHHHANTVTIIGTITSTIRDRTVIFQNVAVFSQSGGCLFQNMRHFFQNGTGSFQNGGSFCRTGAISLRTEPALFRTQALFFRA